MSSDKNENESNKAEKDNKDIGKIFSSIYKDNDENFKKALAFLNECPNLDDESPKVPGKEFNKGAMGFRRLRGNLMLAIACGKSQVRYLDLNKYIAMIENMDDPASATIMLQNFQDQEDNRAAKGQVLGRFNKKSSAIHIIQGLTGRIIRNPSDIALFDVYYLDKADLTSFYLAAKAQISNDDTLETMITTYEGWRAFNVPLDPFNPYGD